MRIWKQALVSLAVVAAAGIVWVRSFPEAAAVLERAGIATASVAPGDAAAPAASGPARRRAGGARRPGRRGDGSTTSSRRSATGARRGR